MKVVLIVLGLLCVSHVADATEIKSLQKDFENCASVQDDDKRLGCFDKLAEKLKPAIAQSKVDNFGKEHLAKTPEELEEKDEPVVFTVKSFTRNAYKKLRITFENGQVWKQMDTGRLKLAPGDKVELKKGIFGVVYLGKVDQNKTIKVKRTK